MTAPLRSVARKLVWFITLNMERESRLLSPDPAIFMRDPRGLLELIQKEFELPPGAIDTWMLEAQREYPCECHDTDEEHEKWFAEEDARMQAYFGITGLTGKARRVKLDSWKGRIFNRRALSEMKKEDK